MVGNLRRVSSSEEETFSWGAQFSKFLCPGDSVGLRGLLGSGKSVFVRGICRGLGYRGPVTSPSFTLMHQYLSLPPIYHFDCFRLKQFREMATTGFDDYLASGEGIVVVEWADIIEDYFNRWTFGVALDFVPDQEQQRRLTLTGDRPTSIEEFGRLLDTSNRAVEWRGA